uniref:Uncharacterized protein n=1 Tax=Equus asinus TaxID=9793 RepID=A0A9L0JWF6_EQUAS
GKTPLDPWKGGVGYCGREGCIRGREIEWREGFSCHQGKQSHLPSLLGHYAALWGYLEERTKFCG